MQLGAGWKAGGVIEKVPDAAEQQGSEIERAAERLGLSRRYVDARGNEIVVPETTLRALVDALSSTQREAIPDGLDITPSDLACQQVYQGADESQRHWLIAVQLYAVRSHRNWGHGDFTDLRRLLELAARLGAAGIGLNPLHALLHGGEDDVSPYSPSSRLFINFLYIDVEALPEFASIRAGDLLRRAHALRSYTQVDYRAVAELKEAALRRCFERYHASAKDPDLADFRAARGDSLQKFARFEMARRVRARKHSATTSESAEIETRFHEYVQWRADRQLRACRDKGRELGLAIGLYTDLAVGVRPDGADVHAEPEAYLNGVSVGAPPDMLNLKGQDWGLTTYRPDALLKRDFFPFRRMLAANMQYAGALRVDHVLWLNRLYLIPQGMLPAEGSYVRYPLSQMLAAIAAESNAHRCIVIGEDLGTVPSQLHCELRKWGVWTYHVMQFERDQTGRFKRQDEYQQRAVATFSTHDLPPFAAWCSGGDLAEKQAIGINPGETEEERRDAKELLKAVLRPAVNSTGESFLDVAAFLARTPSRLVVVGLDDALELSALTNVPGTTTERPNWRLRLPVELEQLGDDARLRRLAEVFAEAGRAGAAEN